MTDQQALEDLIARQAQARALVRDRLLDVSSRVWNGLGSWDEADVERFTRAVVPLVEGGQLQTAQLTDRYIASVMAEMTGETVQLAGASRDAVTALRPVPPAEVYRRPFVDVWSGLKTGKSFADSVSVGQDRLLRLVDDDLSLAHRHAARSAFAAHGVTRYRRIIRPELAKTGTCGLCIAAAGQKYRSDKLLPVHTRCGCDVLPIIGANDPGATINGQDINDVYARVAMEAPTPAEGAHRTAALKQVRFAVSEHGELGPVLRRSSDGFTGPGSIAA